MARSFSNAKRLSSFFSDQISVAISRRAITAAPQGTALMKNGIEESKNPISRVSEFQPNQVYSILNHIRPFSSNVNVYKSQIPSMFSFSSKFSTAASPVTSHARPLSPHLSIYKPQSSSMFSISNRIAAIYLSAVALSFCFLFMKTGLICLSYYSFYQILYGMTGFTGLICYSSIPLILLHILHAVKH
ncbi:uncharacterized protein [Rutidosis leptorrhynchoides]|uniref:uncharacterized protein n=1 Tax=Rutidosis leptorrhynchoides TaxID=125765 RepID=UPI003A9A39DF